jgi:hypothetical protein
MQSRPSSEHLVGVADAFLVHLQYCADVRRTVVIQLSFETGSLRYKALEQALYVGSGRFVIDERGLTVEYRISQVCRGPGVAADQRTEGAGGRQSSAQPDVE